MIIVKSKAELAQMREAGRIVAQAIEEVRQCVKPGITTKELDAVAEKVIRSHGAVPPFKGYPNQHHGKNGRPFPGTLCLSVNEELVHGIPGKRALKEGDILTIDCGAIYKGWHADSAITVGVGEIGEEARRLLEVTERAMWAAIAAARAGQRTGDVSVALEDIVTAAGYSVVREYTSHGIGRSLHEDPQIPNYGKTGHGPKLRPGMTIAIEPMVLAGSPDTVVRSDEWTVASKDGKLTAHFEHTVVVTEAEPDILTRL
ncbi:MAG: type I methionyl aminopeptidase [Chloroflexi bacterium]|nr:type I methionyl aminopeptidase [Chloroflexota bacterium]